MPSPAQPVYRPQPAPTDSSVPVGPVVADTATPRPAPIGTLSADPVITPATQPAVETAGPVRHPLARPADEPAVSAAAIAPAALVAPVAETKVHTIAAGASPAPSPTTGVRAPIAAAPAVRSAARPVPADRAYTVKAGDAWYGLAQRFLGDGNEWPRLFELNKERLSGNREVLPAGVVIELPRDAKISTTTTN